MRSPAWIPLLIVLVAAALFIPGLGSVHLFDWDEINFAEVAREMVASGDWSRPQMAFEPFHEKPPLFMWLQSGSMQMFGVGEFAARFPNAICGIITLLLLYRIGAQIRGRVFGIMWVLAYIGSILPHLYFRSGIIDPWFNLFIFLGLHAIITTVALDPSRHPNAINARIDVHAWLAGIFLGLALLTKGPVGVLIPSLVMAVYWASIRFRPVLKFRRLAIIFASAVFVFGGWALVDLIRNGPEFMVAFFWRQVAMLTTEDAGHGGFFGYHFVVLLIGCFPASLFALREFFKPTRTSDTTENDHRRWMVILFWVVLILFSIVKTKIVHYSSLCYFPLTYLAALQLERIWRSKGAWGWSRFAVGALGTLIALIVVAVPFIGMDIDAIKPLFAADPFALANLDAIVHWTGMETIAGLLLLAGLIAGHFLHQRGRFREALIALFGSSALFVTATLFFFITNIEGYSQRAAVEFFKDKADERCWLMTKGYKSYVPEFYGRVREPMPDEYVLLYGSIDRPVYVVCKVTNAETVAAIPTLKELHRKNGFVFFQRTP